MEALKKQINDLPIEKVEIKEVQEEIIEEEPFLPQEAKQWWKIFAEEKKKLGKDLEYLILNQEINISGNEIFIKLTNPVQQQMLDGFRTELIQFLRTNLKNRSINLSVELDVDTSRKMIYTPLEKFKHLSEKNPALVDLRIRLQLEID